MAPPLSVPVECLAALFATPVVDGVGAAGGADPTPLATAVLQGLPLPSPSPLPLAGLVDGAASVVDDVFQWLLRAVEHATGVTGLAVVFVYSFLIAFILPLPSEVVLASAEFSWGYGLSWEIRVVLVMLVSGAGKAFGSIVAFALGHEAKESGPVVRALRRSRFDVVEWSEKKTVQLARRYGYIGLAMALSVPFFPDTLSIYAFSVLEEDYVKFAAATFVGSVGRLVVTLGFFGAAFLAF